MSLIPPLRTPPRQAAEVPGSAARRTSAPSKTRPATARTALSLRAKAEAARAALTKEAQEIIEEVGRLGRRITRAEESLKVLARDRVGLTGRRSKAETILEQVEERARAGRNGPEALRGPVARLRRLGPAPVARA